MTRRIISEPNFTSILSAAGPGPVSAKLEIVLAVLLAPMDPSKPYSTTSSDAPAILGDLFSRELREAFWPSKANLNFNTHLADTPQQIRTGFVSDGAPEPVKLAAQSWMRRDFAQYKIDFKRIVETSWNNQIILLPPEDPKDGLSDADYMALVANPRMPAHVECSLSIRFVDNLGSANAAIQVVHLKRADDPTINRRVMPLPGEEEFRSRAWLITNEDIHRKKTSDYRWPNLPMSQVAAAHEIGHWLGRPTPLGNLDRYFGHIDGDKYAKTDPNYDQLQYGGTAGHYASLMGGGSLATEYDAAPWLNRVRRHTGALFGWQFVHRSRFVGLVPVSARQQRLTAQAAPAPSASPRQRHRLTLDRDGAKCAFQNSRVAEKGEKMSSPSSLSAAVMR